MSLDDLRGRGGEVPEHGRQPDDLAAILYTSGTTGQPKGAMLTHRNYLVDCAVGAELVPLVEGERVGMMLPLFHANAQVVTFMLPIMIGAEVVMWERFSASTFWQTIDEYKPVTISAVPTILATVVDAPGAPTGPTSLRYVICGAAPLSRELLETFENRLDIRILEGYGMTETTCISSINPFYGARKPGSIGLPVRRQEMRIVDEDGVEVAAGERGEIVMRGPMVMPGYLKNPEANEATIRDGWLHSGDIGYVDEDGYFFIVDRTKDMIIRGGENIYPREIEEVLYQHPDVLECAVIGIPDKVRGEEVLAVVAARAEATLDADEAPGVRRRTAREVQGPAADRDSRRAAEDPDGQDLEAAAARGVWRHLGGRRPDRRRLVSTPEASTASATPERALRGGSPSSPAERAASEPRCVAPSPLTAPPSRPATAAITSAPRSSWHRWPSTASAPAGTRATSARPRTAGASSARSSSVTAGSTSSSTTRAS